MSEYVLITDSSADLSQEMVQELGVTVLPLSFTIQGKTYRNYPDNREMDLPLFYDMLRAGELATTSAVNVAEYTQAVEPILQEGKDVLILAFSSGLSATLTKIPAARASSPTWRFVSRLPVAATARKAPSRSPGA